VQNQILRKRLHKLIDTIPEEKLHDTYWVIEDFLKYKAFIPRLNGLRVFEEGNSTHAKIMMDMYPQSRTLASHTSDEINKSF
jgi:ribosome-associated toxin RatA of RatAB toxin-antitoxin module